MELCFLLNSSRSQSVTMGMDDLLFPLCKEYDILFTGIPWMSILEAIDGVEASYAYKIRIY